jgi:beta-glucanase (GH16 family)
MNTSKSHWATFWMYRANPNDAGQELDIMESLGENTWYDNAAHVAGTSGSFTQVPLTPNDRAQWHVYSILWTPSAVTWYRDGVQTAIMTSNIPTVPMFLIFDISVGTTIWGGANNGSPDSSTVWPATMDVDWVRVYK